MRNLLDGARNLAESTIRRPGEPAPDTIRRAMGAAIILVVPFSVPKHGWTVQFAGDLSDTIGPLVRNQWAVLHERVTGYTAPQEQYLANLAIEGPAPDPEQ